MSRGQPTFRQRDLEAAIKGARKAGAEVYRVEIDKAGKIVIITSRENAPEPAGANSWDED